VYRCGGSHDPRIVLALKSNSLSGNPEVVHSNLPHQSGHESRAEQIYMYMQNHLVLLHIERFLALFVNVAD